MSGIVAHSRRALITLGALAAASPWRVAAARKKKPKQRERKPKPLVFAVATVTQTDSVGTGGGPPIFWVKAIGGAVKPDPDGSPGPGASLNVDAYYPVALPAAEARAAVVKAVAEAAAAALGVPVARVQVVIH